MADAMDVRTGFGSMDGWMHGWGGMGEWVNGCIDCWMDCWMDEWVYGWVNVLMDGVHGWWMMDAWIADDGCMLACLQHLDEVGEIIAAATDDLLLHDLSEQWGDHQVGP